MGLQSLTKSVLGVELDKSSSVRCSDWEAPVLSPQQVALITLCYIRIMFRVA